VLEPAHRHLSGEQLDSHVKRIRVLNKKANADTAHVVFKLEDYTHPDDAHCGVDDADHGTENMSARERDDVHAHANENEKSAHGRDTHTHSHGVQDMMLDSFLADRMGAERMSEFTSPRTRAEHTQILAPGETHQVELAVYNDKLRFDNHGDDTEIESAEIVAYVNDVYARSKFDPGM
jgi:hypothetical protein